MLSTYLKFTVFIDSNLFRLTLEKNLLRSDWDAPARPLECLILMNCLMHNAFDVTMFKWIWVDG